MSYLQPGSRENPLCWYLDPAETLAFRGSRSARASILARVQKYSDDKGEHIMIVGSPEKVGESSVLGYVHPKG